MRKSLMIALVALMGIFFVACNNQTKNEVNGGDKVLADAPVLTFTFAHPKGEPLTYGNLYQDSKEWAINTLHMYVFESSGDDYKLAVEPKDIKNELVADGSAGYKYTYKVDPTKYEKTQYHFLFVANEEKIASANVGVTKSSIISQLQKGVQTAGKCDMILTNGTPDKTLPMTGVAKLIQENGDLTPIIPLNIANTKAANKIKVDLIRTVARIDVYNTLRADATEQGSTDLVVTDLKLKNAYNKAYLFSVVDLIGATDSRTGCDATCLTDLVEPFTSIPNGGLTPSTIEGSKHRNIPGLLEKAFYLHEGNSHTEKAKSPTVEVTFKYKNKENLKVSVPFFQGGKPVQVKRNHLYFVVLGDGKAPIPDPNLKPLTAYIAVKSLDWYEADQINKALEPLKITNGNDKAVHKISLQATETSHSTEYTIASNFANSSSEYTAELKADDNGDKPSWIEVEVTSDKKLKIKSVKANESYKARKAVIQLSDNVASGYKYEILVEQAAKALD